VPERSTVLDYGGLGPFWCLPLGISGVRSDILPESVLVSLSSLCPSVGTPQVAYRICDTGRRGPAPEPHGDRWSRSDARGPLPWPDGGSNRGGGLWRALLMRLARRPLSLLCPPCRAPRLPRVVVGPKRRACPLLRVANLRYLLIGKLFASKNRDTWHIHSSG